MSAAATAAGWLYASGRLSAGVKRRERARRLVELEQGFLRKNVSPARAKELALEALAEIEKREASR